MVSPTLPPHPVYGITLSPKPTRGTTLDLALYFGWVIRIHDILTTFCSDWCIYPEFDACARLHFHGIMHIKDLVKYYRVINKLRTYCFIKVEPVLRNPTKWNDYISKDLQLTKDVFTSECSQFMPMIKLTKRLIKDHYTDTQDDRDITILSWCPALIEDEIDNDPWIWHTYIPSEEYRR